MLELQTGDLLEKRADSIMEKYAFKYENLVAYKEDEDYNDETYRTRFRRDKDRLLYSEAYRRLQNKTQVFANSVENCVRTRLTHTLEVQQLASSIAEALCANKDLAEAIAVGHDIGHTPFGHAVERELDSKLKLNNLGGYSHAIQSIRCVSLANIKVNSVVLEGMLKHDTETFVFSRLGQFEKGQHDCTELNPSCAGGVEAQIVFWSDKIAYLSHDWEDFSKSSIFQKLQKDKLLDWKKLIDLWAPLLSPNGIKSLQEGELFQTRDLIRTLTTNLIKNSQNNLDKVNSYSDVIDYTQKAFANEIGTQPLDTKLLKKAFRNGLLVNFDKNIRDAITAVNEEIIVKYFLGCSEVEKSDYRAKCIIGKLFDVFCENSKLLPSKTRKIIDEGKYPKERIVADHLSGMTDQYAERIYRELFL